MTIVAVGNINDGITCVGPFDDDDCAMKWTERESRSLERFDLCILTLEDPEEW